MCHTHVPDTAGRKAKGGGQSVDLIFVGLTSYLQITPTTGFTYIYQNKTILPNRIQWNIFNRIKNKRGIG